jgi:hypothetical protein
MWSRQCSRAACDRDAVATLTYDYGDQMAVLGPLSLHSDDGGYDLCAIHADRASVPRGWQFVRYSVLGDRGI